MFVFAPTLGADAPETLRIQGDLGKFLARIECFVAVAGYLFGVLDFV
jgi:hypothetical protein